MEDEADEWGGRAEQGGLHKMAKCPTKKAAWSLTAWKTLRRLLPPILLPQSANKRVDIKPINIRLSIHRRDRYKKKQITLAIMILEEQQLSRCDSSAQSLCV